MYRIINGDIVQADVDIIVNASNGIGYMGGKLGIKQKLPGVAESIHFLTKGLVEREAKKVCKRNKILPRVICGYRSGDIFLTSAYNLKATYVLHAVIMRYPGMFANIDRIGVLLPKIVSKARELKVKSIAIPLLGTGTGHLNTEKVLNIYKNYFSNIKDLDIRIYIYDKEF